MTKFLRLILAVAAFSAIAANAQTPETTNLFAYFKSAHKSLMLNPPSVVSIARANPNPTRWHYTVDYAVTFNEAVSGVDVNDFALTLTGDVAQAPPNNALSIPRVTNVSGSGAAYTISVYTGTWGTAETKTGTLRLDLIDDDSITNAGGEPLGGAGAGNGNFAMGEVYDIQTKELSMRIEQTAPSNALLTEGYFPRADGNSPCADSFQPENNLLADPPPVTTLFGRFTQYQLTTYNGLYSRLFGETGDLLLVAARDSMFAAHVRLRTFGSLSLSRPVGVAFLVNSRERVSYNAEDDSFYYGVQIVRFPRNAAFHLDFQYGGSVDYTPNADRTYTWVVVSSSGVRTTFTTMDPDASAPPTLDEPNLRPSSDTGSSNCDNITGVNTNLQFNYFADPDAEIQLLRDGTVVGIATTGANGVGIVTDPGVVPNGAHAYTLRHVVNGTSKNVSYQPLNVTVAAGASVAVTVNQAQGQSDPATISPVNFTVEFSEPVTGFDRNDIVIGGTAVGDFANQITVTGSGAVYNVAVGTNSTRRNGTLSISVSPSVVTGTVAITNAASTSTDNTVTINMLDADGDSITDAFDACPNTAVGVPVNDAGCEIGQCFAAPAGMNHWYAANENVPINYTDSNRAGEIHGGTTFVQSRFGRAFSFDGTGQLFTSITSANTVPSSYAAWVKPALRNDATDFPNNVISTDRSGLYGHGFGLNVFPGGSQLKVEYNDGFRIVPNISFNAGQWYHIAAVYTSGNVKTYVNGNLVDDFSFTQGTVEDRNAFWIGAHNLNSASSNEFFKGEIDEVQAFSRALSPAEIAGIAASNSFGVCYPEGVAPRVNSISRNPGQNSLAPIANVDVTVIFSKPVTGVDADDFALTTTGYISGASIANIAGSGSSRTVSINPGSGHGTIRLDVIDNDTIIDVGNNPLGGGGTGNGNFTAGEVISLVPTAASVSIAGRIVDSRGRAVSGAIISIADINGLTASTRSNSFGFYRFEEIASGATYFISIKHKRFDFFPQTLNLTGEVTDLNFIAQPRN